MQTGNDESTNQPAEKVEGQAPEETNEQGAQPDNEQAGTTEDAPNEEQAEESNESEESENEEEVESDLSREDAIAALKKIRKSEAKYRTRLREVEEKLATAKSPEEVEKVVQQLKDDNAREVRDLMVENVALKHRLPEDLTETLKAFQGESREDFEAHAKILAKYAAVEEDTSDREVSGGLDPNSADSDAFDPKAAAAEMRRKRRFGR